MPVLPACSFSPEEVRVRGSPQLPLFPSALILQGELFQCSGAGEAGMALHTGGQIAQRAQLQNNLEKICMKL